MSNLSIATHMQYSSLYIRDKLIDWAEFYKTENGSLTNKPKDMLSLYIYIYQQYITTGLIITDYEASYPHEAVYLGDEVQAPDINLRISKDLDKCCLYLAMAAWLSWDEWRYPGLKLSYGMVLRYPCALLPAAAYISRAMSADELGIHIPDFVKKSADCFAVKDVSRILNIPERTVKKELGPTRMSSIS
jgi:hypothetical protein